jgi:hypothetical protein
MIDNYEDVITLPHYEPKNHKRMGISNRASQFAPFAALTGYEDQIKETARLTDKKIEIDETSKNILNNKLQIINNKIKEKPEVSITYFIYDKKKSGGAYTTITGNVKKIDSIEKFIIINENTKIFMKDILSITSNILEF